MNAGLGSLNNLKAAVLPQPLRAKTNWDTSIQAVGLGVAIQLEQLCNRFLVRAVGDTYIVAADCSGVCVPRAPIEVVTSVGLQKAKEVTFTDITDRISNTWQGAGIIEFDNILGSNKDQVKVTYTGGYWFDTTEDGTGSLPSGAFALPADIQHAWQLQCQAVFEHNGILKSGVMTADEVIIKRSLSSLKLIDDVKAIMNQYLRY